MSTFQELCATASLGETILASADTRKGGKACEITAEFTRMFGRPPGAPHAHYFPMFRPQASGLDTKYNVGGKYTVGTEIRDLIYLLRNQTQVLKLGAQFITGLTANLAFPTESADPNFSWEMENTGADTTQGSDASFGQRTVNPHGLTATRFFSRNLLTQSAIDVENFNRTTMILDHAIGIDAAAIAGAGTLGPPLGILNLPGLPTVAVATNGGAFGYAHAVSMEQTIANANADPSGWLTTPDQRAKMRQVFKNSGSQPLWGEGGTILDYTALVSKNVPSNLSKGSGSNLSAVLLGDWSKLLICQWAALEIIADPFVAKKTGMIEVTSIQFVDVLATQIGAFCACVDAA